MPKEINCEKVKENIDKLKNLKNEFLAEMERIEKDGIAGNVYELKKEIEDVKGVLDEELKEYLLIEEEKKLNQDLKQYIEEKNNDINLTLTDTVTVFSINSLQKVKESVYARNATIFVVNSLKIVKDIYFAESNFQKFFDDDDNFNWEQAKKERKLILPEETRKKVEWLY